MNFILAAIPISLYVAGVFVLMRKYLNTRDVSFAWLGAAVVVWPLLSKLLGAETQILIHRIINHQTVGFYPFSLIESGNVSIGEILVTFAYGQQIIGLLLLLIALLYLCRTNTRPAPSN